MNRADVIHIILIIISILMILFVEKKRIGGKNSIILIGGLLGFILGCIARIVFK